LIKYFIVSMFEEFAWVQQCIERTLPLVKCIYGTFAQQ